VASRLTWPHDTLSCVLIYIKYILCCLLFYIYSHEDLSALQCSLFFFQVVLDIANERNEDFYLLTIKLVLCCLSKIPHNSQDIITKALTKLNHLLNLMCEKLLPKPKKSQLPKEIQVCMFILIL